jgi:RimJ/RimL family protein N-acetyltransferase
MTYPTPDLPTELETERLLLRAYHLKDANDYLRMVQENRCHLFEFLPEKVLAIRSEEDAKVILRWFNDEWQKRCLYLFGLWAKSSGCYVGETYLSNPDWQVPSIELGYFLVQSSTGQGYATEAASAVLRYAFDYLKVTRVDLQCRTDNLTSQRVAERLGFMLEGCQRQRHRKKDGSLVDRLWYGLLREEWDSESGKSK